MSQSRAAALLKALANVLAGYGHAVGLQLLLFPAFGLHPTLGQSLKLGLWFTALSVMRGYALRRLFERFRTSLP